MRVGVVKEIKPGERRVALTPGGVAEVARRGHRVLVEAGAGERSGFDDPAYAAQGAVIVDSAADVWASSELLLNVKEPVGGEHDLLGEHLTLFAYCTWRPTRRSRTRWWPAERRRWPTSRCEALTAASRCWRP
jgi:alanine dehydrogenase